MRKRRAVPAAKAPADRRLPWSLCLFLSLLLLISFRAEADLQVVDEVGQPVAGAVVEVRVPSTADDAIHRMRPPMHLGETDAEGRLASPLPALQQVLALVDHPEYAPATLPIDGTDPPRTLVLLSGRRVAAQVRSQEEIESGEVCATWEDPFDGWGWSAQWRRCAEIGENGSFELGGLPADEEVLEVTIKVPGRLPWRGSLGSEGPFRPSLPPLDSGSRLRGRLLGPGDQPVVGGEITTEEGASILSGPDGRFEFQVSHWPARLSVVADGYRHLAKTVEHKAASPGDRGHRIPEHSIQLEIGEQLLGRLLGEQGVVTGEATLRLDRAWPDGRRTSRSYPLHLEEGEFRFHLPEPGVYGVRIAAPGYRELTLSGLHIAAGEARNLGDLQLDRGAAVRGRVIDSLTGEPLAGVVAELLIAGPALLYELGRGHRPQAISDSEGTFLLAGLSPGRYQLRLHSAAYAPGWREVVVHQEELVELPPSLLGPGEPLSGCVEGASGSESLRIQAFDPAEQFLASLAEATADSSGCFETEPLPAARYRLLVHGERPLVAQEVEHSSEETRHRLVAATSALGGVVTRRGQPVAGGWLRASPGLDPANHRAAIIWSHSRVPGAQARFGFPEAPALAQVQADGTFELPAAPHGPVSITYTAPSGDTVTRNVILPLTDEAEAWIFELAGFPVSIRGIDETTGEPIERVQVEVADGQLLPLFGQHTDAEGQVVIPSLPDPPWRLELSRRGYRSRGEWIYEPQEVFTLPLVPEEPVQWDLRLQRAQHEPARSVLVSVLDPSSRMIASAITNAGGHRSFSDLPSGEYSLAWIDSLAGAGAAAPKPLEAGRTEETTVRIPHGFPLRLRCNLPDCQGAAISFFALHALPTDHQLGREPEDRSSQERIPLTSFLSGYRPSLRFGDDGELNLGVVAAGRYELELWVAGRRWTRGLVVVDGAVKVLFP
ncbi:MAG: carboxypeptidase regulatory-like domain-containing protein [Acidobacteriota bacterium]|nr:carboxypeptidase regulatory-like domain-containing protein [Acidobacteriota bacterium]